MRGACVNLLGRTFINVGCGVEQTRLRAEVIGKLAKRDVVRVAAADEVAIELEILSGRVYVLF